MPRLTRHFTASLLLCSLLAGCNLLELRDQAKRLEQYIVVSGTVSTDFPSKSSLVVVLSQGDSGNDFELVDHFVVSGAGRWKFFVKPGKYYLSAFEDRDGDLVYHDEPALTRPKTEPLQLEAGDQPEDILLVIPHDGRSPIDGPISIRQLQARTPVEQATLSLTRSFVAGEITSLDDPRFNLANARMGLWRRLDFTLTQQPGVYFLEAYDPHKIPVLFVHGITGFPREFEQIVAGLDRNRFQPWFFFYPSGFGLTGLSEHLASLMIELRNEHGFDRLCIVAHSMGGLLSRNFIFEYEALIKRDDVRLFLSISSPFGGDARAAKGLENAPEGFPMAPSWKDMATGSEFLTQLFFDGEPPGARPRALPRHIRYHLLFGYDNGGDGASGDGVVTLASSLRPEIQDEALSWLALDATHNGILEDSEAIAFIHARLVEVRR